MSKSQTLFNTLMDKWLETKKQNIKRSTFCKYEQLVRLHVRPYFAKITCAKINQKFIDEFYATVSKKCVEGHPLATGTLRCLCMIVNGTLRLAQDQGYIKNQYLLIPKLSREYHLVHVFSKENQTLLEQYLYEHPSQYSCGILLALYTGIRIGELCALTYENLDLINGYIRIIQTVQRTAVITSKANKKKKTELVITSPKSRSAYRMIPLPDFLIEYLDQNLIFSKSRRFIFSRTGAAPVDPRTIQLFYKQTLEELQIPYLNFHCLRHTFATRCITMGWDVRTLSEVLGHSDIKITMEYYFHSSMEYKKLQMQKIEPLIRCVG